MVSDGCARQLYSHDVPAKFEAVKSLFKNTLEKTPPQMKNKATKNMSFGETKRV